MVDSTIKYYNKNAKAYFDTTASIDMGAIYGPFLNHLSPGSKVLDAGCGSGRDSYFFKSQGFKVTAFDASEEMVELSSQLLGKDVFLMRFEDLNLPDQYDGIWACASLLHVASKELVSVITNLSGNLRNGGVFYMSFKYGDREYWKDGRYFNCMDEETLREVIEQIPELRVEKLYATTDVRPGRDDEQWLNVYLLKAI